MQATSSEDVFGLSASAGGGFVGVAGGVGVTILSALTEAFVTGGATLDSARQSVNVAAVDYFKSLTVAGGAAGGFVGVAGGVDIGVANSSVAAVIGVGSHVHAGDDVNVYALSRKDVQTYALSIGGGFVGVAGSVSVWSIGTQPVTTYSDAAGGPDKGTWSSGGDYNKGDVVTDSFDGKRYAAKNDLVGDPTAPHADPANWEGDTDSLAANGSGASAQGSADSVASGDDHASDDPGYKTVLGGTSAAPASAPAWSSGTAYSAGDKVTFTGKIYKAKVAITHTTTDPSQNPEWTDTSNEGKTNSYVDGVVNNSDPSKNPQNAIAAASPGGSVASSALHTTVPAGTSAQLNGTIVAGHSVHVAASDNLAVTGLAGAVAGGFVGIGAAVLILNVQSATEAKVGPARASRRARAAATRSA